MFLEYAFFSGSDYLWLSAILLQFYCFSFYFSTLSNDAELYYFNEAIKLYEFDNKFIFLRMSEFIGFRNDSYGGCPMRMHIDYEQFGVEQPYLVSQDGSLKRSQRLGEIFLKWIIFMKDNFLYASSLEHKDFKSTIWYNRWGARLSSTSSAKSKESLKHTVTNLSLNSRIFENFTILLLRNVMAIWTFDSICIPIKWSPAQRWTKLERLINLIEKDNIQKFLIIDVI